MSSKECPECGSAISDEVDLCPVCGKSLETNFFKRGLVHGLIIGCVLVLVLVIAKIAIPTKTLKDLADNFWDELLVLGFDFIIFLAGLFFSFLTVKFRGAVGYFLAATTVFGAYYLFLK